MKAVFASKRLPEKGNLILIIDNQMVSETFLKLDNKMGGNLKKALENLRFEGKKHQTVNLVLPQNTGLERLVIASVGKKEAINSIVVEETSAKALASILKSGAKDVHIIADFDDNNVFSANIAFGAICGNYRFDKYKTKKNDEPTVEELIILCSNPSKAMETYEPLSALLQGMTMARNLVSEPGNAVNPETMANEALKLKDLGVDVEVINEDELKKLGFNLMLSVGQGSDKPSKLVVMKIKGNPLRDDFQLAVVGKGVTFDTGGISLKASSGMEDMKMDMAGAGVAISLMKTLALRGTKANVVALAGLVENMPSGKASRPGDVLTSLSGQTVEIISTDAEGRMVLGDVLWFAQERFKPEIMIDLATLTGAMITTLGYEKAGLFANNDDLADNLWATGERCGEYLWRLPFGENYDELIKSDIADIKNYGGSAGGSITASQFLKRFVKDETKWCHLDIASTAWIKSDKPLYPKGGTGFGVRLLDCFIKENLE